MYDFGFPAATVLHQMQLINRLKQSKYYPMYRKIWISKKSKEDTRIEWLHENYHVTLGKLTSGNMVYAFWRMLRVLNAFVDYLKERYAPEDDTLNENVLSLDMHFAKHDDYVALGDLYLDIYRLFKKTFKLTVFAQEGAATYVSLHAPQKTGEIDLKFEERRQQLQSQLSEHRPYQFAKQIAEKWCIDRYGVQDTAKIALDFPYFFADLLSTSYEEIDMILSEFDSERRWKRLLEIDEATLKLIYCALERQNLPLFIAVCDQVFGHHPIQISFDQWLSMNFFDNPRVHRVLKNCGFKVTPADLEEIYNSDEMLDENRTINTLLISGKLPEKLERSQRYENGISIEELCEIQFMVSRATQFICVKWFWEEFKGGYDMYRFVNFIGKRKHLERIQDAARKKELNVVLPIDIGVDDLDSFFSPEMIVQIIVAIASSHALASVIVEAIKATHKEFSIKSDGKITEINITNATDEDIDKILKYIGD